LVLRGRGAGCELGLDVRHDIPEAGKAAPRGCRFDLLDGEAPGRLVAMPDLFRPSAAWKGAG